MIFVYCAGKLVAEYSTQLATQPSVNYTTTDHLGSPRIITDELGQVKARRDFMPFGEEVFPDGTHRTANLKYTPDGVRQKFTGYQKDEETQLDFAEARMYENRHGRFTAVDPLLASGKSADPQTFNRYVYVLNNPLVLIDPDGLQVGTASGAVYRNGRSFAIFAGRGSIPDGYSRVRRTIKTTTAVNGVDHHVTVRSNGWTVGDRVDNQKFSAAAAPVSAVTNGFENAAVRALANGVSNGVSDGTTGILKGIGNTPAVALNGATGCIFNCGVQGLYFGGSNPFAVPLLFTANNDRQASYMSAGSTGTLFGLGVAGPAVFGGSSSLSVVPEVTAVSSRSASSTVFAETGSYLHRFESGKFYAGKGNEVRMTRTGNFFSRTDPIVSSEFFPATSNRAAFMNEHRLMMQNGGPLKFDPLSPTYNKIFSPGRRFF